MMRILHNLLRSHKVVIFNTLLIGLLIFISCSNPIKPSPAPGILRVTLQSVLSDSSLIIVGDTVSVSRRDSFGVTISQGKIVNTDSDYTILYPKLTSYRQQDRTYNVLDRDPETGYTKYTIFQSYVSPDSYRMLELGANANMLFIGEFQIPVNLPPDTKLLVQFPVDFTVSENDTTEINLMIEPFNSVQRYRNNYRFQRQIEVTNVQYYQ